MFVCIYECVCVCVCIYIYIYIYVYGVSQVALVVKNPPAKEET